MYKRSKLSETSDEDFILNQELIPQCQISPLSEPSYLESDPWLENQGEFRNEVVPAMNWSIATRF